jgi:DNA-directed RNA polymerase subunit M/transcription elongation factor TFIIS
VPERPPHGVKLNSFNDPPGSKLKCPLCTVEVEDENMLIFHTQQVHKAESDRKDPIKKEDVQVEIVKEQTEKCPKCFKRFKVEELPVHMEQEHFM